MENDVIMVIFPKNSLILVQHRESFGIIKTFYELTKKFLDMIVLTEFAFKRNTRPFAIRVPLSHHFQRLESSSLNVHFQHLPTRPLFNGGKLSREYAILPNKCSLRYPLHYAKKIDLVLIKCV